MNIQHFTAITPLRARMIADMTARNLGPASRSSHLHACKRFPVFTSARLAKATNMDFVRSNLEEKDS